MFHPHYFNFAMNLCTNWNTKESILNISLCRNNDYELLGFDKKVMLLHGFQEPKNELPICTDNGNEAMEIQDFKYVVTLALTTLLRVRERCYVLEFIGLIKAHINKNQESAKWILWQFCNSKIIFEFLLECNDGYMRRLVVGILYCAMLKVYKTEKLRLFAPAEGDVLLNFTNGIFRQLPTCRKHSSYFEQFFQVMSRLAILGPEIRESFIKTKTLIRFLEFIDNLKDTN